MQGFPSERQVTSPPRWALTCSYAVAVQRDHCRWIPQPTSRMHTSCTTVKLRQKTPKRQSRYPPQGRLQETRVGRTRERPIGVSHEHGSERRVRVGTLVSWARRFSIAWQRVNHQRSATKRPSIKDIHDQAIACWTVYRHLELHKSSYRHSSSGCALSCVLSPRS